MQYTNKYKIPYPESTDKANIPADMKAMAEALEAVAIDEKEPIPAGGKAGEVLTKVSDNDYDVNWQDVGSLIKTLEEKVERQNTLINTELSDAETEGEEIEATDSAEWNANLGIEGNSKQATRSGKNLLPNNAKSQTINGIVHTVNNDGTVHSKGTSIGWGNLTVYEGTLKKGEYILSSGGLTGGNTFVSVNNTSLNKDIANTTTQDNIKFSINEDTQIKLICCVKSNITIDILFKPMVRLSTVTDDTYEQYGASPTPEFPSNIRNVGDNVNLFDKDNIEEITGYINYNTGVFATPSSGQKCAIAKCKPNTTYSISGWTVNNDKTIGSFTDKPAVNSKATNWKRLTTETEGQITTGANDKYLVFFIYNNAYLAKNDKLKVEQGTQATPYTPYKQGSIDLKVENENLFDFKKFFEMSGTQNAQKELLDNGIKINFSAGADAYIGEVTTKGSTLSENMKKQRYLINIKPNTQYSISSSNIFEKTYLTFFDKDYKSLGFYDFGLRTSNKATFTSPQDAKYISFRFGYNNSSSGLTSYIFINISLKVGVDTIYTPHKEQSIHFPLAENQVLHEGDCLASDGIHQTKGSYALTGDEINSKYNGTNNNAYYGSISKYISNMKYPANNGIALEKLMSNYFPSTYVNDIAYNDKIGIGISLPTTKEVWIGFGKNGISTIAEAKSYLKSQYNAGTPVIIEYELAEEIVIPYTEEQQKVWNEIKEFTTYKGTTYIISENDVSPVMKLKYKKSNILRIDKIEKQLEQLNK